LFSILLSAVILPSLAFAQLYRPASPYSLAGILKSAESAVWIIFTGIVVICFVVAGILLLTAQGQPEKLQAAKSAVIWGLAGIVVGILAYSILAIVMGLMAGGS